MSSPKDPSPRPHEVPAAGEAPPPPARRRRNGPVAPEVREHALLLIASGVGPTEAARRVGVSSESIRKWRLKAEAEGTMPAAPKATGGSAPAPEPSMPTPSSEEPSSMSSSSSSSDRSVPERAPKDPGAGLSAEEAEAIVELRRRHPSMGPEQIRAQLKRFRGWRVSRRAIARVLRDHGFELVHTGSRPKGQEEPERFEAPHRNDLWQMDFAELRVGAERVSLLVVLDDFSRFVVGHDLFHNPTSEDVVSVLTESIRRHGVPRAVYTDRGGPFLAWGKESSLGAFLERHLIDHHVSPAYRPMGRGKVEALIGTVRRELWDVVHFDSVTHERREVAAFVRRYNERRAHLGLDGLTPADRFFGRADEVRDRMEAASRKRQTALAVSTNGSGGDPFVTEESLPGGPVEVLRLLVVGGRIELRLLGHCVDLGPLTA